VGYVEKHPALRGGQGVPKLGVLAVEGDEHLGADGVPVGQLGAPAVGNGSPRCIPLAIPKRYAQSVTTRQIAVRLPVHLLEELDELVAAGTYESRASAVRAGIEAITARRRRQQIDEAILDGYHRIPPSGAEDEAALASLRDAVAEEPW
jgi:Arc/MetJ-type ribon-helix-helix transcriptional regulator